MGSTTVWSLYAAIHTQNISARHIPNQFMEYCAPAGDLGSEVGNQYCALNCGKSQTDCFNKCKVTLVAFVIFFSKVSFHMSLQFPSLNKCKVALVASLWFLTGMNFQMRLQFAHLNRCKSRSKHLFPPCASFYMSSNGLPKQSHKGWGLSAKLGKHSAICGKLGTALQAYALNPCTKFPPNPTSRKVNT